MSENDVYSVERTPSEAESRSNRIILRRREFCLQLVDDDAQEEEGGAMASVPYKLVLEDGTELTGETDDEGFIRRRDVPDGDVTVIIDDNLWAVIEEDN